MHKRLNLDYLVKNEFLQAPEDGLDRMATNFKVGKTSSGKNYAFMGQSDHKTRPAGFIRCVNEQGDIYEGNFNKDFERDGFCVSYLGNEKAIQVGWYRNNLRHGNWMLVNGQDMSVTESGWFQSDKRLCDTRQNAELK